jgi:hypothetical protein
MLARQIAIGFGIAVIFPLLVYYGVSSFHPAPRMADFVGNTAAFNAAAKEFSRILIYVATPLGIAAILIGSYTRLNSIGTGLIFGGIVAVALGYANHWASLDDWVRFVSLLAGFAVLLFVGYRQFAGTPAVAGGQS